MKKAIAAIVLAGKCSGSAALAGSLSQPTVEAPVIAEDTAGSSAGYTLPLFLLLLMSIAVAD